MQNNIISVSISVYYNNAEISIVIEKADLLSDLLKFISSLVAMITIQNI